MMVDLHDVFAELRASVPDGPPDEADFLFKHDNLPMPPPRLTSDRVHFRKIARDYNGWHRVDNLALYVDEQACRDLGLFLLACAFHDPEHSVLELSSSLSEVRRVVYRAQWPEDDPPVGLVQRPTTFRYFPSVTKKHPWLHETRSLELAAARAVQRNRVRAERRRMASARHGVRRIDHRRHRAPRRAAAERGLLLEQGA